MRDIIFPRCSCYDLIDFILYTCWTHLSQLIWKNKTKQKQKQKQTNKQTNKTIECILEKFSIIWIYNFLVTVCKLISTIHSFRDNKTISSHVPVHLPLNSSTISANVMLRVRKVLQSNISCLLTNIDSAQPHFHFGRSFCQHLVCSRACVLSPNRHPNHYSPLPYVILLWPLFIQCKKSVPN